MQAMFLTALCLVMFAIPLHAQSISQLGLRMVPRGILTAGPNTVTEFHIRVRESVFPFAITAGPDGNLWFTEACAHKIGRITADSPNEVTEFPIPGMNGCSLREAG